ncbi:hypothetical protein RRG08_009875 [Elysia crispata]|uniref:Uncharacterized protein n=1 Tax=Elysia crispata TaxID=231223 RepID=A0AAE0Z482_9GAST|nr:hypothetical protein RRG08_009875 [Elysia crispata]
MSTGSEDLSTHSLSETIRCVVSRHQVLATFQTEPPGCDLFQSYRFRSTREDRGNLRQCGMYPKMPKEA